MDDMSSLILGIGVGFVGGIVAKEKLLGNKTKEALSAKQQELDTIYSENEKYRKRNKEMERQIEYAEREHAALQEKAKEKS